MLFKAARQLITVSLLGLPMPGLSAPAVSVASDKALATNTLITATRSSASISIPHASNLNKSSRDKKLKNSDIDIMPALVKDGNRLESNYASVNKKNKSGSNDFSFSASGHDYILFDASAELISDFNFDGFYHRFSVTFDVDTIYDVSYVFAEVYLSYEGGPWNHYGTSDSYHIYLDNENDTMTIETELEDGFSPGYYDVRIEVYNADSNEWLLSYGPYDNASLSALPLEDSYYDDPNYTGGGGYLNTEIIVSGHGHGAMSWLLILLPALIALTRTKRYSDSNGSRL